MEDIRRILVTVTATEDCIDVLHYAERLAERFGGTLLVLDVIHNPFAYSGWNLPMPSLQKDYERLLKRTRDHLHGMIGEAKGRGTAIQVILREGDPVEETMKVVTEEKIDLLVLPSHEETRIEHFLSGKMVARIVRRMPCSVLLLKQEMLTTCEA